MSTTKWQRPFISGTLRVYVAPCRPLDPAQADELHATLGWFFAALRLRMFAGTLTNLHEILRGDDGKADARFEVVELELGALRVLHGMFGYFAGSVAPLGTVMAWGEPVGTTPNLFDVDASVPTYGHRLPFHARLPVDESGPGLVVTVVFGRALTVDEKDRLEQEIRVWAALVNGGYPGDRDPPGSSALGPLTVRYDDPRTMRLHAEGFLGSTSCFEPLKALAVCWSQAVPLVSMAVE